MNTKPTLEDIKANVRTFIVDQLLFGQGTVPDGASFLETGIIDSTGVLELIAHVESTYEIKVENDELVPDNLDSLNAIAAFLERKLAARQA